MGWKTIVFTYLFGGLTFLPLLLIGSFYVLFVYLPVIVEEDDDVDDDLSEFTLDEYHRLKMTEIEEKETMGVKTFRSGWLTVTREYHSFIVNASDKQLDNKNTENKSAYTSLYKLVKNTATKKFDKNSNEHESDSSSNVKANQTSSKAARRKNKYYGVLRHGNLFLYKDEHKKAVLHVIVLSSNVVTIWPRDLQDGELFSKKSAICILKKKARRGSDAPPKSSSASLSQFEEESTFNILDKGQIPPKNMGFFIYPETNYEKENWYFDLIKATKRENFQPTGSEFDRIEPSVYANPLHFKTSDILTLIQTLHSSEGQLQTRWLNAIIGRLFLSYQNTEHFENIVRTKILKKLEKINKPGFLDDFQIKRIDVGNSAPFISNPKLIDLNPDGTTKVGVHFTYKGKISMQVSTKVNINLGSAFKTREVSILLAVTLNRLEGPLLLSLKSPPSSRFWYTFEENPDIDLTVEPVVSQRQISYSMINNVIKNKLINAFKESLVLPSWDDITYFNTSDEFYRGGIWDTKKRPDPNTYTLDEEEKEEFAHEYGLDPDELTINSEFATGNDYTHSDENSLASKSTSIGGSLNSRPSLKKKTRASIDTSNDQFLSDGSFVSKAPSSPLLEDSDSTKSRTMQIITEEASAGKKTLSNGLKKISKWYTEKNKTPGAQLNDGTYKAPEMITQRKNVTTDNQSKHIKKNSTSDLKSVDSNDNNASPASHKTAPQARSFPAEFLYGLDTEQPDYDRHTKSQQPNKIQMKSPYLPVNDSTSSDNKVLASPVSPKLVFPKRKPVSGVSTELEHLDISKQKSKTGSEAAAALSEIISTSPKKQSPPEIPKRPDVQRAVTPEPSPVNLSANHITVSDFESGNSQIFPTILSSKNSVLSQDISKSEDEFGQKVDSEEDAGLSTIEASLTEKNGSFSDLKTSLSNSVLSSKSEHSDKK